MNKVNYVNCHRELGVIIDNIDVIAMVDCNCAVNIRKITMDQTAINLSDVGVTTQYYPINMMTLQ